MPAPVQVAGGEVGVVGLTTYWRGPLIIRQARTKSSSRLIQEQIQRFLRLAENLPDPAQQPMLDQAIRELETMIQKFDGCAVTGTADTDDVVTECTEQAGLIDVAGRLAAMITQELVPAPCEVPPEN